ncbi:MAG TPA: aminodeoxychorismate synthase component I [Caulobacteraceae bacterium]|nr:aminodeoxychorismate synthase component I [Caulobacteraceae bacterium]
MKPEPPFVLLEDRLDRSSPAKLYTQPVSIIRCDDPDQIDAALGQLEAGLQDGLHAAGFIAYELGHALEPRLRPLLPADRSDPLIWMGLFPAPHMLGAGAADAIFASLPPPPPLTHVQPAHDRETHVAKVRRVLDLIHAGDIYQANLTFPISFRYGGCPLSLYAALRSRQPTAHSGVVAMGDDWVLSVSPELFVRIAGDCIESRPMKGTAPRGTDRAADDESLRSLVADPKQQAENLMITDLIRNDLARICEPGSVRVPSLFAPETHPTFHAMTSTVTAQLRAGVSLRERIGAIFPCGSIVGAPKIRAAQILAGLEAGARGVYTGAIGALAPDGGVELNVAIRTAALRQGGAGTYGVGGGVVADSDPDGEYDEARLKGRILENLAEDFGLIETFRWSAREGFVRLPRHLDRLEASSAALGFAFDRRAAEYELARCAGRWAEGGAGDRRMRLLLRRTGDLTVESVAAPATDDGLLTIGFASGRLDAGDPFLRHKTTCRAAYDVAVAEAKAAGWAEALILNRDGQVADASRHTLFAGVGESLVTPPLTAGALPGVLRGELIEAGRAAERSLTPRDLEAADQLFIGNSLRGLRAARLTRAAFPEIDVVFDAGLQ